MRSMLALARMIDAVNERVGRAVAWLVLVAVLVSTGNAISRYALSVSSNAWLEIQWYLFSAIFLLAAGYTLLHHGHVRIDILYGRYSPRTRAWIDILGALFFLMPMAVLILYLSWPVFVLSYSGQEMSGDAGGLVRWPVKVLMPLGFALLVLQGLSQIVKRIAYLRGEAPLDEGGPGPV